MGENVEILRYTIDDAEAVVKLANIDKLNQQITAGKARGQDTRELESQRDLAVAVAGGAEKVRQLTGEEQRGALVTADLIGNKQKLAAMVRLMGGEFAAQIGPLGSVLTMLSTASGPVIALAAGLGLIGMASAEVEKAERAVRQLADAQSQLNANIAAGRLARASEEEGMTQALGKYGLRTPEGEAAASDLAARMQRELGFTKSEAQAVAPLATAAGLSPQEAGMLAILQQRGMDVRTPAAAQKALADLGRRPDAVEELQRELESIRRTEAGQRAIAAAPRIGQRLTPEEIAFAGMQRRQELPPGVENLDQFRRVLDVARGADDPAARQAWVEWYRLQHGTPKGLTSRTAITEEEHTALQQAIAEGRPAVAETEAARRRMEFPRPAAEPGAPGSSLVLQPGPVQANPQQQQSVQTFIKNETVVIGTINNTESQKGNPARNNGAFTKEPTSDWMRPYPGG